MHIRIHYQPNKGQNNGIMKLHWLPAESQKNFAISLLFQCTINVSLSFALYSDLLLCTKKCFSIGMHRPVGSGRFGSVRVGSIRVRLVRYYFNAPSFALHRDLLLCNKKCFLGMGRASKSRAPSEYEY